jgi:hypothetical protein
MRRFLIQTAEATIAEGVEFTCGIVAVRPLPPAYRSHTFHVDHVATFVSLESCEAHFFQVSEGLSTLVCLDLEV